MKRMVQLFLVAFVTLTSAFFVSSKEAVVEAACEMGQYYDTQTKDSKGNPKGCRDLSEVANSQNQAQNVSNIEKGFNYFAMSIVWISSGLALIIVVLSGFQYVMSEGDPYKIQDAKNNLLRAGIGMLIAFSLFNILNLIDTIRNF